LFGQIGIGWGSTSAVSRPAVVCVLKPVEALVSNSDELIRLLTILRKSGHSMVHTHADNQLQRLQHLSENCFHSAAKRQGLLGVCLR
jgi:hypothetical protein